MYLTVNAVRAGANCMSWLLSAPNLHNSSAMHLLLARFRSKVVSASATPWSCSTLLILATSLLLLISCSSGDCTVSNSLTGSGMAEAVEMRVIRMKGNMMMMILVSLR